ncbi:phosphotransferase [Paenibacillus alvei]|nr:phosphotransferase [Paenibacillus alvei]
MGDRGKGGLVLFPVVYSTLCEQALRTWIAENYSIGTVQRVEYLLRGMNDTYKVYATDGMYIFRVYRGDWRCHQGAVEFEMDVLLHLQAEGLSVSTPITALSGERVHALQAPEGVRFGVLFTYAEGEERSIDDADISLLFGQAVAQLHAAGDSFASSYPRTEMDLDYLIHKPLQVIANRIQHRPKDIQKLTEIGRSLSERINQFPNLDWGICHGDLHGNTNISYRADHTYTHYDFDLCGYGYRAYDIAEFRLAREERLSHDSEKLSLLWNAFLEGYQSIRPLRADDIRAVPLFVAARQLWLMALCLHDLQIVGSIDSGDDFIDEKMDYFNSLPVELIGNI